MPRQRKGKLWEYLVKTGVLEKGNDDEIKAAKRAYRKQYFLEYKKQQRQNKPEYAISFSKQKGEHEKIITAAKNHKMTIPSFLKAAAFAYLNRTYIVPDRMQLARLYQVLSDCLNEIKSLTAKKERFFFDREQKMDAIEKRIQKLEYQISEIFGNPPLVTKHDYQNQIA